MTPQSALRWDQVLIVIPTMPKVRDEMLVELLFQIADQCQGATVKVIPHVEGTPAKADPPRVMGMARDLAPGRWTLHLEDDAYLAPDFGTKALWYLATAQGDADVVEFMTLRERPDGVHNIAPKSYSMTVAMAVDVNTLNGYEAFAEQWYERNPKHHHASDLLLGAWVSFTKGKIVEVYPNLVQHRVSKSTLGPRARCRQSPTYRRVYGEVR